uniref:Cytochrome b561 n=1 Tax=Phallusia mammillata TaxID=59560 RepID=A0A6F9D9P7_9ASCI|nr:cytochrome b561 [Phallusia mammillata]
MPVDQLDEGNQLRGLPWMVALSQGLGVAMIVLIGIWLNSYMGGFAWDGTSKEFNLHPLCMICGLVFLYGEAIMTYRIFRQSKKLKVKIIHAGLLFLALFAAIVGLVAVFQFHNKYSIKNMYSLHSWCGMITVVLFCLQLAIGFLCFLLPGARANLRSFYLPLHQFWGSAILILSAVTCISGINEKLFFVYKTTYQKLAGGAVMGNMCGVVIVMFVMSVLFVVQRQEWKRPPDEDEDAVSIHFRTLTNQDSDSE